MNELYVFTEQDRSEIGQGGEKVGKRCG